MPAHRPLPRELLNKTGSSIRLRIGSAMAASALSKYGSPESATKYLRSRTYMLDNDARPHNVKNPRSRSRPHWAAKSPFRGELPALENEIARLHANGRLVLENNTYAAFAERGDAKPTLLRDIGRRIGPHLYPRRLPKG